MAQIKLNLYNGHLNQINEVNCRFVLLFICYQIFFNYVQVDVCYVFVIVAAGWFE